MIKKLLACVIIFLFIGINIASSTNVSVMKKSIITMSRGNILYVGGSGSGNYTKIQDAIDNASDGNTVFVYDDSSPYEENIVVDKSINLIGENRDTTKICYWEGDVITLTADFINISGFSIGNIEETSLFISTSYINIRNNNFTGCDYYEEGNTGIEIVGNNNFNYISNNIFYQLRTGIKIVGNSNFGYISNNIFYQSRLLSIDISGNCYNTTIINNIFLDNWHDIVISNSCHNTTIIGNKILGTGCCAVIDISGSNNNIVKDNYLAPNWLNGIELHSSHNNTINNNTIIGDRSYGIELYNSRNNNLFDNSMYNCGTAFIESSQNYVKNNTVNNKPLIYLENISDLIIPNNSGQIVLIKCENITIQNQDLSNTSLGVELWETTNCSVSYCFFSNNYYGISIHYSNTNIITYNNIKNKNTYSIEFWNSQYNTIIDNNIINNYGEMRFWSSQYNMIMDNFISNNSWGITLTDSKYNKIINNIIKNGYIGIELQDFDNSSNYNKITGNSISNQDGDGIYIWSDCYNNDIYHNNFFNNKNNAKDRGSNTWDDGYPSGGNFWDDYSGEDKNGDGIGDTPYSIPGDNNKDRYPLMYPWNNSPPDAPIIEGPIHGKVGLEYEYNFSLSDPDGDRMFLRVDWGNGTAGQWQGPYDSGTTVKLKHAWEEQGNFIIKGQAKDIFDAESDWGTLNVTITKSKLTKNFLKRGLFKCLTIIFLFSQTINNLKNYNKFIIKGR